MSDSENKTLQGWRVLVTRPAHQAENLCRLLEAQGAKTERLPLISVEPLAHAAPVARQLDAAHGWDGWIFTSANAVRHGHVPGRDFLLQLTLAEGIVRVEVTDTRAEKRPPASPPATDSLSESGRGLLLVAALADDWGVSPRRAAPGKTVWADLHVRTQGHPLTHRVTPGPTDLDLLLTTASLLRDDLGSRPEDASHGGRRP